MKKSNLHLVATILIGFVAIVSSCSQKVETQKDERPNIIFLMDDQHKWDALGLENEIIKTPTLDNLAKSGIRFTQAVCQAPMCIPSRNSMMLGLYPNQLGVTRNAPDVHKRAGIEDGKLPNKPLAQVLKENGYETAGFGKTHWGVTASTRGFETRYAAEVKEIGANMMVDLDPEGKEEYWQETKDYGPGEEGNLGYIGETSKVVEENHRDGWVFNKCVDYINKREDERPLFLYLSFLKPHAGHNVPEGFEGHYDGKEIDYAQQPPWEKDNSPHAEGVNRREMYEGFWKDATEDQWKDMTMRYYANCTWIDDMFARTMDALKKKGLLENALIVYVTDHGEMLGERYYRFNKYCLYESSVRVPLILSGFALPKDLVGVSDNRPAEVLDIYPTILKAVGIKTPETLPGINLLSSESRPANFCALHERKGEASFMWRTEEYKLILRMNRENDLTQYDAGDIIGGEFYNLKQDAEEWNNLYNSEQVQSIQEKMTKELVDHLKTMKLLEPNAIQFPNS
ncbi:MAG: sulfatase-like hydrolase/transferase [Cyclobacteriaceae bacterium]